MNRFELKRLISQDKLENALSGMRDITSGNKDYENSVLLLINQFKQINKKNNLAIAETSTEYNNLVYRFLNFIDDYFNDNYQEESNNWNIDELRRSVQGAINRKSKEQLIELIRCNSFLLHDLYSRKFGIQPAFHGLEFCKEIIDFLWLNDNSDGPEWVLVEILTPNSELLSNNCHPSSILEAALSKFNKIHNTYSSEKLGLNPVFGAINKFRFIIVGGSKEYWDIDAHAIWRQNFNRTGPIELRTQEVLFRCFEAYQREPNGFWSFEEHPITISAINLESYCKDNDYLMHWVKRYKYI